MGHQLFDPIELKALSILFSYPDTIPERDVMEIISKYNMNKGRTEQETLTLTQLQNLHVRLFINALPEVPCPPYGSYYLEGVLLGASTVALKELYRRYGIRTEEMPDHISVELEFLSLLASVPEQEVIQDDLDFLIEHLRKWTPEFFKRTAQQDPNGFYGAVSRFAESVLL